MIVGNLGQETIQIKYLNGSPQLTINEKGDWIDLYLYEDLELNAGGFALASMGVAMKLPAGYEALMAPRSSTFKNYGLIQTNSVGVIDNSYCGENDIWKWPCCATKDIFVPAGTRLCQFRIIRSQPTLIFETVDSLSNPNRGGFGSSGL